MSAAPAQLTRLLRRWSDGDPEAFDQLVPLVYERLRQLARRHLGYAPDLSLNATALVHETYLRLARGRRVELRDRSHFLAVSSRIMRHLLVDHARARRALKRGAGVANLPFDETLHLSEADSARITDLDRALQRLERLEPRQSRILEQRYFGGLTLEDTAESLDLSLATVKRELRSARAWLALELGAEPA